MFIETQTERSDVIGIACEGKLSVSDLKQMHILLHERLAAADKPGLVVDLTKFEGYTGLAAMREDLKMDTAHRNDFSRIAVVGDETWQEWGTTLAKALTRAEMRWFDANEMPRAVEWAGRDLGGGRLARQHPRWSKHELLSPSRIATREESV